MCRPVWIPSRSAAERRALDQFRPTHQVVGVHMPDSLDGVRLKMARADEHLDALQNELAEFLSREPYSVFTVETDDGDKVWRLRVNEDPPLRWSAILGDAVHNLRAALDLIAWELVRANGKRPQDQRPLQCSRSGRRPRQSKQRSKGRRCRPTQSA